MTHIELKIRLEAAGFREDSSGGFIWGEYKATPSAPFLLWYLAGQLVHKIKLESLSRSRLTKLISSRLSVFDGGKAAGLPSRPAGILKLVA